MNIFRKRYSVCEVCKVHFEPVTGPDSRWGYLCFDHRRKQKELDLKKEDVIRWATDNWERLHGIMTQEHLAREKEREEHQKAASFAFMEGAYGNLGNCVGSVAQQMQTRKTKTAAKK